MITQYEAIIEAFENLGGERTRGEIEDWATKKYGSRWKDFGTPMADMVPISLGGNTSSLVREEWRVLRRTSRGRYCLAHEKRTSRESFQENPHATRRDTQSPPSLSSHIRWQGEELSSSFANREFWVPGNPAPFATRGEKPWKETLQKNLPQRSFGLNELGLTLDLQLIDLAPLGHPLDVDNLCEPVFSIMINRKGWFGGSRSNLYWWRASKYQKSQLDVELSSFQTHHIPN